MFLQKFNRQIVKTLAQNKVFLKTAF